MSDASKSSPQLPAGDDPAKVAIQGSAAETALAIAAKKVKAPAALANTSGHVELGTAFAVLLKPRGALRATQVVFAEAAPIAAAIAAGDARAASQEDVDLSNPFHYPLPPADAPAAAAPEA